MNSHEKEFRMNFDVILIEFSLKKLLQPHSTSIYNLFQRKYQSINSSIEQKFNFEFKNFAF